MASTLGNALLGLCPQCGKGKIFAHFLTLKKECPECHLSFENADTADGPAFFVITGRCRRTCHVAGNPCRINRRAALLGACCPVDTADSFLVYRRASSM